VTERDFQSAVLAAARLFSWRVAHFRAAQTRHGWRTPVEADGKGFPDLILVHPRHGLIVRELKANGSSKLTREQADWITCFEAAGVDAGVWRPDDWNEIEKTLRGTA
jgi:VRR-NUC domain-containing protein